MASNLGVTPDYILYEVTWENLILYGYATPSYLDEDSKEDWDPSLDANNPELTDRFKSGYVVNPFV